MLQFTQVEDNEVARIHDQESLYYLNCRISLSLI